LVILDCQSLGENYDGFYKLIKEIFDVDELKKKLIKSNDSENVKNEQKNFFQDVINFTKKYDGKKIDIGDLMNEFYRIVNKRGIYETQKDSFVATVNLEAKKETNNIVEIYCLIYGDVSDTLIMMTTSLSIGELKSWKEKYNYLSVDYDSNHLGIEEIEKDSKVNGIVDLQAVRLFFAKIDKNNV